MSVLIASVNQYSKTFFGDFMVVDDFITMKKTSCTTLSSLIGNGLTVKTLSINGIYFGSETGKSKLELSNDRTYLFIYTEDEYVSVAKMPISNINNVKFGIDDDGFELYP